jgi:hypothetical protein
MTAFSASLANRMVLLLASLLLRLQETHCYVHTPLHTHPTCDTKLGSLKLLAPEAEDVVELILLYTYNLLIYIYIYIYLNSYFF